MTPISISRKANNPTVHSVTAANQEWPTFALHVTSLGQTSPGILVNKRPKRREVQIDTLTTNADLAALKKNDPFLYYSIPSIREAEITMSNVDVSCLEKLSIRRDAIRLESKSTTISCKACISFECHIDKLMTEYFMKDDNNGLNESGEDYDNLFLDLLRRED